MHVLPTVQMPPQYSGIYLHLGIFLLCTFILAIVIYLFMDYKKTYNILDIDEGVEIIIGIALSHALYSLILYVIVEMFFIVIKYLIIQ
jgi:hypothetical protein